MTTEGLFFVGEDIILPRTKTIRPYLHLTVFVQIVKEMSNVVQVFIIQQADLRKIKFYQAFFCRSN